MHSFVLGCGGFGGLGSAPEYFGQGESDEQAFALMDAAWSLGLRWFDTADAYGGGRSESAIGAWIQATGNRPRITTKTFNPMQEGADSGLDADRILRQIETSLERIGVDSIDLYLAHGPDPETPLAETTGAFEQLVEQGLIGSYGYSNLDEEQLVEALSAGRPSLLQNSYSLLDRGDEERVIPMCVERGVRYQAFSPLAGGWLTGKYRHGEPFPPGSRMGMRPEAYAALDDERVYSGLERLAAEADRRGVSMPGLALAWLQANRDLDSAVVGPRRPEHLMPLREALEIELEENERRALASLFP